MLKIAKDHTYNSPLVYPTRSWISDKWWHIFQDEQLTRFINIAFQRNPTLKAARSNIFLAKATANRIRASLYPYLSWGADVSRQKLSTTGVVPFGTSSVPFPTGGAVPEYFTLSETEFNFTYNFDIWSKNRNTLKAALGEMNAAIADTAFAQLQLSIAVALAYFQLQVEYKRELLAKTYLRNRNSYLELQTKSMAHNLINEITLNAARISRDNAAQVLFQIQNEVVILENQLKAYLANDFEDCIKAINIDNKPLPRIPLPCDLHLNLISHRPDILAQLWLIESAGRQIEVAKAGFYPDFNLTALYGYQTIHFRELFKWPSAYFNVDPAVSLPIFDGGRLQANLCYSEIHYDKAIYEYNEMVLNAAKEVFDSLSGIKYNHKQYLEIKNALELQEKNVTLTRERVIYKLDSELDFLTSEESMLSTQSQELITLKNTYQSILLLIQALGGGYKPCYMENEI